ncbi:hypothetical protein [Pseudomonas phage PARCL1pr]|nr:hypothetical protein [Pseudomonas phage PARCL1pr]
MARQVNLDILPIGGAGVDRPRHPARLGQPAVLVCPIHLRAGTGGIASAQPDAQVRVLGTGDRRGEVALQVRAVARSGEQRAGGERRAAEGAEPTPRRTGELPCLAGHERLRGTQAVLELGDIAAVAGEHALGVTDTVGQQVHRRCIGFGRGQRIGGGRCSGCIGGHLVAHRYPGAAVPAFRRIGVAGGVDPQVLRQALVSGRRGAAIDHFPLGAGRRGGCLRGLLGGRHILLGSREARLQAGHGLPLRAHGAFHIGNPGGHALHRLGISFGLRDSQGIGCSCSGVGGHLVRYCHPGAAIPALGRVGIAGGVDPQVLRQALFSGRRG